MNKDVSSFLLATLSDLRPTFWMNFKNCLKIFAHRNLKKKSMVLFCVFNKISQLENLIKSEVQN